MTSLPLLRNIATVAAIFIYILALVGNQIFGKLLKYQCMDSTTGVAYQTDLGDVRLCGKRYAAPMMPYACPYLDITSPLDCPTGYTCTKQSGDPEAGLVGFEYIPKSMLNVFQILTMSGWSETLFYAQEVSLSDPQVSVPLTDQPMHITAIHFSLHPARLMTTLPPERLLVSPLACLPLSLPRSSHPMPSSSS